MSGKKLVGQRQIQKMANISMNSIQNISVDDFFLEEETSHDSAVIRWSPNISSHVSAILSDESIISSINDRCAIDFTQTDFNSKDSISQMLSTNIVLTPTRMAEIFSDYSLSESNQEPDIEPLVVRLRRWYCSSHINLTQLKMLLTELKPDHSDLPLNPRCIVQTSVYVNIKVLNNGGYVHVGIKHGLVKRMENGIKPNILQLDININIDGLPVSKSSSVHVWPILGRCIGLYDQRPFVIGLFCGSGKPEPLDSYLTDFIDELKVLQNDGIKYSNQVFRVFVNCFICDAPARAYLKCIKSHSGYNGCERCIQEGEHDGMKVCYDPKYSTARTDESFDLQIDESHHLGVSLLTQLSIKFIKQFPMCSMHLVWEGVTKKFLSYLTLKAKSRVKLRASDTNKISCFLQEFHIFIPREFARKSRSLYYAARWKATEHRLFLLYTEVVALKQVLSQELYDLFLLLHVAVRIVSCEQLVKKQVYVDFAEKLFAVFVEHCAHPTVFEPSFVSYNIHSLLHLCDDVRRYGVIENFSGFPFENYLGVIKRLIRSGAKVLQQLAQRLAEMDYLYNLQQLLLTSWLPSGYDSSTNEYKTLSNKNFTLSTNLKDSFFYSNSSVAQVKKILKSGNGIVLIADVCNDLHDFFENPIKSSKVGIWKLDNWSHRNIPISLETICGKCIVLPFENELIALKLLHTS